MSEKRYNNLSEGDKEKKKMLAQKARDGEVIIRRSNGSSVLVQEMRAQGMNLMDNIVNELGRRNLAELKTRELVEYAIKLVSLFVPRPKEDPEGEGDTINLGVAQVMDIVKQIGTKSIDN